MVKAVKNDSLGTAVLEVDILSSLKEEDS